MGNEGATPSGFSITNIRSHYLRWQTTHWSTIAINQTCLSRKSIAGFDYAHNVTTSLSQST